MLQFVSGWMWLALAAVLFLLGLLVFLIWRRRRNRAPVPSVPPVPTLASGRLARVWTRFLGGIPWSLRRSVLGYPLFLVVGEAGSGKSTVIERCIDWEGQPFRFHPSYTDDPLLQIYLGARTLVLELSAGLLYDTGPAAYRALARLWRQFPGAPRAVAVIDAGTLLDPQPDRLRRSAQALAGKLEAFGELEGHFVPLTLVLSQMDKVEGYAEFCAFLERAGIPLRLEFDPDGGELPLADCLDEYKNHLSRALIECTTRDYLKIVAFLGDAPILFRTLAEFLRIGGHHQGTSRCPVVRLCLLSEHGHNRGSNPFLPLFREPEAPPQPWNRHLKAALALTVLGLVYLWGGYRYEKEMLLENLRELDRVNGTPLERYATEISPLFLDFSADLAKNSLLSLLPGYFQDIDRHNKLYLIRGIRRHYLLPRLRQLQSEPEADLKTNTLLALLYAEHGNEMAQLVSNHFESWAETLKLPGALVRDYVRHNSRTDELDSVLDTYIFAGSGRREEDLTSWLVFFHELQQILRKPSMEAAALQSLQQRAGTFLDILRRIEPYHWQDQIVDWLSRNTPLGDQLKWNSFYSQSQLQQAGIHQTLDLVRSRNLDYGDPGTTLGQCLERAQALARIDSAQGEMAFTLGAKNFVFAAGQWADLVTRSRISLLLRDFIRARNRYDGWVFFDDRSFYADLEMNPTNEGRALFAGKGRIDGRLTRDAFEQKVKPAVTALDEVVAKLPISAADKGRFTDFVQKNLQAYANRYADAYLNYFRQFQIRIDSPWDLRYVLQQLQQPDSPLLQTLLLIKDNTALDLPPTPQFQALGQRLGPFRFLQRLLLEQNGIYPEFGKYQLIMLQLQTELESREPAAATGRTGDGDGFRTALSPLGRIALSMLLNEEGSYLRIVKSWLQNAGIGDFWQQPFLAPVQRAGDLGRADIRQTAGAIWSDLWSSNVKPLLGKFPFSRGTGQEADAGMDELKRILHPQQGAFWAGFRQYLAPLLRFGNGLWMKRQELLDTVDLPGDLLPRVNAAQQLSTALWDRQGNPKALPLAVRTGLLPTFNRTDLPNAPLVSLAYLRSGGSSALGFNQQPAWQKLSLEWWASPPASAGLEFRSTGEATRTYADITASDSAWNFFRLLTMGRSSGNQYRWTLNHPAWPGQKLELAFTFQNDPWLLFARLAGS